MDGELRHAGYIASWIKLLQGDSRAFFTAASKAQAAADYLRGLALSSEAEIKIAATPQAERKSYESGSTR
jgi:antirestriction protein ArdC